MKVYCPECKYELLDAKKFQPIEPMTCPNCQTSLRFISDSDKTAPLAIGIFIFLMILHSLEIISKDVYVAFLIIGIFIGIFILFTFKIIAVKDTKE
ncbi:hypothetical protein FJR48_04005 [Sulfurimonas lithotrophica]|uniref:Uncharacterized protein n=1 Tax=Sulfurimonas lithotrophica TaxID=2590022 RepID=A0A5P8P009_9BACT|nr:hypothetical protein [Sulfurimonas lithotrophica]QFR48927.1 hypothetical protein FJR48_04005 [Sulfurimonas lithotrophica]